MRPVLRRSLHTAALMIRVPQLSLRCVTMLEISFHVALINQSVSDSTSKSGSLSLVKHLLCCCCCLVAADVGVVTEVICLLALQALLIVQYWDNLTCRMSRISSISPR